MKLCILTNKAKTMIEYKGFKVLNEYPHEFINDFTCFVWCKGEHYKSHAYGKNIEDTTWGLGETQEEALKEAIDMYWYYENEYYE